MVLRDKVVELRYGSKSGGRGDVGANIEDGRGRGGGGYHDHENNVGG